MAKVDYYETLGVTRSSSGEEIKKAYRKLAIRFHPDKNPDDPTAEERFKECTEAYQVLSSEENRRKYDQFGHAAFQQGGGFADFGNFADDIFGDLFSSFFGGAQSAAGVNRGRDLSYRMELDLEEAANGIEREIEIERPVLCETCDGSGAKEGTSPETCKQCSGQGQIRVQQGFFAISRTCPICQGGGTIITDPCKTCDGSGQKLEPATLSVNVPAGIDDGQRLKLRGEGERVASGAAGDLYVEIAVKPHSTFKRQGAEIVCEFPLTYSQAVLGGSVEVPTLEGEATLKIPAGTESGKVFRLRGKGIVDMRTGRNGDQHVRTYVYVPQDLSDRQRELLEELAQLEGKPVVNESRTFIDRFRDLF